MHIKQKRHFDPNPMFMIWVCCFLALHKAARV